METIEHDAGNGSALAKARTIDLSLGAPEQAATILGDALKRASEQRALLKKFVEEHMVEGVDYGVIPGTEKKDAKGKDVTPNVLLKPGAEKLTELFRCVARFRILKQVEDWEKGFFYYQIRVRIVLRGSDLVVAEGFGSCNSRETRYRYRQGSRKCPACGGAFIIKGREEYGGGWLCFAKKGGCGAKFGDGDKTIEDQEVGRIENPDIADQVNTILKIAKKRAHVDGAITLARCSDLFTQDLEEHEEPPTDRYTPKADANGKREAPKTASAKTATEPRTNTQTGKPSKMTAQETGTSPAAQDAAAKVSAEQLAARYTLRVSAIWKRAQALGMTKDTFANWRLTTLQGLDVPSRELTEAHMKLLEDDLAEKELMKAGG